MRQQARAGNLRVCYRKKQMDVSFLYLRPVIDNEFRRNIVKVVCGSTRLCLFPFRKQAMPFLTVDAIIGNQACQN